MRVRSILSVFIVVSLLILFVFLGDNKETIEKPIQIECKLKNERATLKENNQFCVAIKLINNTHPTLMIQPELEVGFKSYDAAFYFEAYNMDNKEVNIETESDYDWNTENTKMVSFSVGDTIKKTFCSNGMFAFKDKGIYKLRLVFNPNKPFEHQGKVNSQIIYSNWETITVK